MFTHPQRFAAVVKYAKLEVGGSDPTIAIINGQIKATGLLCEGGALMEDALKQCLNDSTLRRADITIDALKSQLEALFLRSGGQRGQRR